MAASQAGPTNGCIPPDGTTCRASSPTPGSTGWHRFRVALSSVGNYVGSDYTAAKIGVQHAYHAVGGELTSDYAAATVGVQHAYHYIESGVSSDYAAVKAKTQKLYSSIKGHARADYEGARCIYQANELARELAPHFIVEETGCQIEMLLDGFLPSLYQMMRIVGIWTLCGAGLGAGLGLFTGGVLSPELAVVGGDLGFDAGMLYFTWMGLKFLVPLIEHSCGEYVKLYKQGIYMAWDARKLSGRAEEHQVRAAAEKLARAAGVWVRIVIQGCLTMLLLKGGVGAAKGIGRTGGALLEGEGAAAIADARIAELVKNLSGSKLGSGFAKWIKENWRKLRENPKLQPKTAPLKSSAANATEGAGKSSSESSGNGSGGGRESGGSGDQGEGGKSDTELATEASRKEGTAASAEGKKGMTNGLAINGKVYTGRSTGAGGGPIHPDVQAAYDAVPEAQQSPFHGKCAEPRALSAALDDGADPAGGTSVATRVGGPREGEVVEACPSCKHVLNQFGVKDGATE